MTREEARPNLRNVLAELYLDVDSSRRVAHQAGLNLANISFGTHAANTWDAILREAEHVGGVDNLLNVVLQEYGASTKLQHAWESYKQHSEGDSQTYSKDQKPSFISARESYEKYTRDLLKSTFTNEADFDRFCREQFSLEFKKAVPLYWKIELLIEHCYKYNKLKVLPAEVFAFAEQEHNQYVHSPSFWETFVNLLRGISSFGPFQDIGRQVSRNTTFPKAQTEIKIEFPFDEFTSELREASIRAFAAELGLTREQIRVINVREGSIVVRLELPSDSLARLIELYESDKDSARKLGISYVVEHFDELVNLTNVRALFSKGLTYDELRSFCQQHYPDILTDISSSSTQSDITDVLLAHVSDQSEMATLLTEVQLYRPSIYSKYRPYYNVPRRPGQKSSVAGLSRREIFTASTGGISVATGGALALSLASSLLFTIPSPLVGELASILNLLLIPLGNSVGNRVSAGANYKRSQRLGMLAVACYGFGYSLGDILGSLLVAVAEQISSGNAQHMDVLILSYLSSFMLQFLFAIFFSVTGAIGFLGGGYLAYNRAS